MKPSSKKGFTLIELSIVLVIIGLIVGGVLVGQSLINAASIRAQITQIEKFQTAARTFQGKYGYLPGDIPAGPAAQFGFASRGAGSGQGDGNGYLTANSANCCNAAGGELAMFWVDLSAAGLIDGSFNTAASATQPSTDITGTGIASYLPQAKIGGGNYVYVWAGGLYTTSWAMTGNNYYGVSVVTNIKCSIYCGIASSKGLTVTQAYTVDKKVDDGLPESGNLLSIYSNGGGGGSVSWADGGIANSTTDPPPAETGALSPSSTSCYDNGGVSTSTTQYSLTTNNGNGVNCVLSFRFQ